MNAAKIRHYAIAIDALTRVQGMEQEVLRIKDLLRDAITEEERQYHNPNSPPRSPTITDEIHF